VCLGALHFLLGLGLGGGDQAIAFDLGLHLGGVDDGLGALLGLGHQCLRTCARLGVELGNLLLGVVETAVTPISGGKAVGDLLLALVERLISGGQMNSW